MTLIKIRRLAAIPLPPVSALRTMCLLNPRYNYFMATARLQANSMGRLLDLGQENPSKPHRRLFHACAQRRDAEEWEQRGQINISIGMIPA
jgi:hypothetical protein